MVEIAQPAPVEPTARRSRYGVAFRPRGARNLRFLKAYFCTFQVIASYLWLSLLGKVLGREVYAAQLPRVHAVNARRIERTIVELQGLFIKVGQLISIMTNFLPEQFRKPLESLQDRVPPRPFAEIDRRIRKDLGAGPDDLFAAFDRTPIASASLGQVHRAKLRDGTDVVVKVQHADIDEIVRMDLRTIWQIMLIVSWFVPMKGIDVVYAQVREMILAELDFVREAAMMERIGQNLADEPGVTVPTLHHELCTQRVLTMSYVDAVKIVDLEELDAWKIDRAELARRVVRAYCKMVFVDGVYHADPHPGNLLVKRDGTIVLVDFGAVAELSPSMRQGIPDFLEGVIRRDTGAIFRSLRAMGFIAHGAEAERASERIVEYFHRRFQDEVKLDSLNLKDIKIDPQKGLENFLDLRRQDIGIRELTSAFQVPKDWVLLERTTLLLAGVCTSLDPEMNPMVVIRPYLQEFVLGEDRDFATLLMNAVKDTAMSALSVPDDVRKYLNKAMRGDLEMRFRGLHESANLLYALGHQVIYTLVGLTASVIAFVSYVRRDYLVALPASLAASFFMACFALSVVLARKWRKH